MISKTPREVSFYNQSITELLAQHRSSEQGLSPSEAARRLVDDGPNSLVESKTTKPLKTLLSQFKSPLIGILIVSGAASAYLGQKIDAFAIFAIVLINAAIGFYQELSAEKSIAALKQMTTPFAKVRREGRIASIPATDVVVGDILVLEAGDLVAADARLLKVASLRCTEAQLTGESEPLTKQIGTLADSNVPLGDRSNMVFMGTGVSAGTAEAVVVATAMRTELGHIAELIGDAAGDETTPLTKKLQAFARFLIWIALSIVTLLFVLGWLRGKPFAELFMSAVSLAVAAVPEGLPAVVTVALSLGVLRMSRRQTLVRRLPAVETLGSTTVICTDKTGTLTLGEMTLREFYVAGQTFEVSGEGYGPSGEIKLAGEKVTAHNSTSLRELALVIVGCNNSHLVEKDGKWRVIGDPTEGALLAAGLKAGLDKENIERDFPKQFEFPFDSDRKLSSMIRKMPDAKLRAFVNGAPGILLQRCTHFYTSDGIQALQQSDRDQILAKTSAMAKKSLRVLASAWHDLDTEIHATQTSAQVERDLVFVGLSGMKDPPRPEAIGAIKTCQSAGIRVLMITGDHHETATAIANELGIIAGDDQTLMGTDLDKLSEADLQSSVAKVSVYARVSAEHKLRIVRALQSNGAVVAMTGDGVNDAPAIKGADIGIAMGISGTEVSKQAADMIIVDDNFATIVAAVEEGRGIYANIRKTLQYLLAGNAAELVLMLMCVSIGLPTPLLPIHLLYINLVTDGLPALCLATDKVDSDVMKQRPQPSSDRIMNAKFIKTMLFTGLLTAALAFFVYVVHLKTMPLDDARGAAFAVLVFAELLRSFGARSETRPIWKISVLTNPRLLGVVCLSIGLQFLSQHNDFIGSILKVPQMSVWNCLKLLALGAIPLLTIELLKVIRNFRTVRARVAG